MSKVRLLGMLAVLVLAASGCVQMNMSTTIDKDGSGTMDMTMTLSQVVSESLEDLKTMQGAEELADMDQLMSVDKDELQERVKDHGVKIKTLDRSPIDGREGVHIVLDFEDLEGLSYAMRELSGEGEGLAVVDLGDGTYALRPHDYGWPEEPEDEAEEQSPAEMDPEMMGKQMELMGKMMAAMGELEFVMKMTVPGDIVRTSATRTEGRTAIWTVNQSNMMSAGADMEPDVVFSAKGLKMKTVKE
jgi:hypothetical protein